MQVSATSLTVSVRKLISGDIDIQQFEAATAPDVLKQDANEAFLEGLDDRYQVDVQEEENSQVGIKDHRHWLTCTILSSLFA